MSQSRQASGSPFRNPLIESKVVKELEKKKSKAKRELDVFKAVRENATRIFFGVMRPRLKKQNAVKYVDMSALDRDLMVLKQGVRQQNPAEPCITLGTASHY